MREPKSWDSKPRVHLQASGACCPDAHLELVGLFAGFSCSERCDLWVGAFLSALLWVAFAYQQMDPSKKRNEKQL